MVLSHRRAPLLRPKREAACAAVTRRVFCLDVSFGGTFCPIPRERRVLLEDSDLCFSASFVKKQKAVTNPKKCRLICKLCCLKQQSFDMLLRTHVSFFLFSSFFVFGSSIFHIPSFHLPPSSLISESPPHPTRLPPRSRRWTPPSHSPREGLRSDLGPTRGGRQLAQVHRYQ